ncbi:VCBS repeat-containing protein [Desulfovibrionales bacterium]
MKLRSLALACALALTTCVAAPALALAQKTPIAFAVLPFKVNGPEKYHYLSAGIQDMLISRLYWKDATKSVGRDVADKVQVQAMSEERAGQLRQRFGCDWVIWGTLTVMGEQCSLDVYIIGKKEMKSKTTQISIDKLIPALECTARDINTEIFELPLTEKGLAEPVAQDVVKEGINKFNTGLAFNEDKQIKEFYLNPQFRYAGDASAEGRLATKTMPFVALGMVIGDLDKDGKNEITVISNSGVHVFRMNDNHLELVTELVLGVGLQNININLVDLNKDSIPEIIVSSALRDEKNATDHWYEYTPRSYILNFKNNKLEVVAKGLSWYLNVVKMPPSWAPTLIGQKRGEYGLFAKSIYKMNMMGKQLIADNKLMLPVDSNVFNFTYLPQETGYKILAVDERDHIRVYNEFGDRQHITDTIYSGSALGLEFDESFPGIQDKRLQKGHYYVPARLLSMNLDNDNRYEILINHPISAASMFFERYRLFPQGEIHCLTWDGVGMSLVWKTRRIKGSVVDVGVGDANNSGTSSLVVLINTHPGAIPSKMRRSQILVYPLDFSRAAGGGAVDNEFRDEELHNERKH